MAVLKRHESLPMFSGAPSDTASKSRFRPRRSVRVAAKNAWFALVGLLFVWALYQRLGRLSGGEPLPPAGHQVYRVTKDGVTLETGDELAETPVPESSENTAQVLRETVEFYDLADYSGTHGPGQTGELAGDVVLFLMPLRNAGHVLPMAFNNIMNVTYNHGLIDIAFLVLDCLAGDPTLQMVFDYAVALQNGTLADDLLAAESARKLANVKGTNELYQHYMDKAYMENVHRMYNLPELWHKGYRTPFRLVLIYVKDFGQVIGQSFLDRHAVKVQGIRRKLMGRARNWLTASALKPYHLWVYWRDVDIETCPGSVIQDLMKFDYDVMVPNIWRPLPTYLGGEQAYDLNSWIESPLALQLAKTLQEDDVIVEGYAEYPTYRVHLGYIREKDGDPNEVVNLDGIGGVLILAKARIFRQGAMFPAFTLWNHAETEAFGKLAKAMGFKVGGLPHYTIWHIYEPSEDDLKHISKLERKKRRGGRG